jgi:metal-responsive CopG/Arc/MetJ family transcriptional regulator
VRRVAKVTISLPTELLTAIEHRQKERGESRSEVIADLLEAALRREREQADVERYVRGYLEQPETADEVAVTDRLAIEAATWDPWP